MTHVTARQLRENLAETLETASRGEDVIVTRNGREQAVVISMDAYRALTALEDAEDARLIDEARAGWDGVTTYTLAEVMAETEARSE